jgi:hypothetical protein
MKVTFDFNESDTQETLDIFLQASKMHQGLIDLERIFKNWDKNDKEVTPDFVRSSFYSVIKENDIKLY